MREVVGTIFLILVAGLAAAAQGMIAGRVTDPQGAVLPGAKLLLSRESDKNDEVERATSNSEGEYIFTNVPLGVFRLRITVAGFNREFTKRIELNAKRPVRSDVIFSFAPCSDEEDSTISNLSVDDYAEIVRELVGILLSYRPATSRDRKIIFSPANFSENWLLPEQRSQISILSRDKIQEITERDGELVYYTIAKPVQRGRCVGIALVNNWTVEGQMEDANMAGGSDTYEFRKVDKKWTWIHLSSEIS